MADKQKQMRYAGIFIIFLAMLLSMFISLTITNFSISDTDVFSYIIVVMLMGFLLLLFHAKDTQLNIAPKRKDILASILLFLIYFIILSYARLQLSFIFMTYRLDMLLSPILLIALISAIFGLRAISRMKVFIIYMFFASPLLLLPLGMLTTPFAILNAQFVFTVLKTIGLPLTSSGITITAPTNYSISIAATCVDLGAFAALILFMIPVSYLYNGSIKSKIAWISSGVLLLFVLNLLRMLVIGLFWVYDGISSAISIFHTFIGPILFYAVIIMMMLIIGRFKLTIINPKIYKNKNPNKSKKTYKHNIYKIGLLPILFGIVIFYFSMPYLSAINAPISSFNQNQNINYPQFDRIVLANLGNSRQNVTQLENIYHNTVYSIGSSNNSSVYVNCGNPCRHTQISSVGQNNNSNVYVIVNQTGTITQASLGLVYNYTKSQSVYMLNNGLAFHAMQVIANNRTFDLDFFSVPTNVSNSSYSFRYGFFKIVNQSSYSSSCTPYTYMDTQNQAESLLYNTLNLNGMNSNAVICRALLVAASISNKV